MKMIKLEEILKIIIIICTTLFILFACINISQASGEIPTTTKIGDGEDISDLGGVIIGILQWVGSAVAVIMVVVNGIKYMTGSIEEKAEYKKAFIYYLIGGILVFSAVNILSWVYNLFK